tara:strand:- start:6820 stop:6948 length:129 start_codon:yes stop_codon:yes gene_type:complete
VLRARAAQNHNDWVGLFETIRRAQSEWLLKEFRPFAAHRMNY